MRLPSPDYLAILAAKRRTVTLHLVDGEAEIRRARLRLYAELQRIAEGDGEPEDKAIAYIEMASGYTLDELDPARLLEAYANLLDLNKTLSVPAILRVKSQGRIVNAFHYEGRWLVALVEALVEAGWDAHYVLEELDPDEAWLYLQEIEYNEWGRYQQQYALSTVGRDKKGKQQKLQPPAWSFVGYAEPRAPGVKKPTPAGIYGVVVDFNDPQTAREIAS